MKQKIKVRITLIDIDNSQLKNITDHQENTNRENKITSINSEK